MACVAAQVGDVPALGSRRLAGVVDRGQLGSQRLQAAGALTQPQVLECGDVAQVPHQRAHQRVVHPVEVLGGHGLHQRQGAGATLGQGITEPALVQRLSPSSGQCCEAMGSHGGYRVVGAGYRAPAYAKRNGSRMPLRWYVDPVEASRAETTGYLAPSRLTVGELGGCAAALVFVLSLFLPWYGTSSSNPNSELEKVGGGVVSGGDTISAWDIFPILRWILLAAAIAPFILAWIVMRRHKLEWKPGEITMIVGVAAFVLVLCNGIILGRPGDSVEISLQWGYPIALLACMGMAVCGFMRQLRHTDAKKPPGVI